MVPQSFSLTLTDKPQEFKWQVTFIVEYYPIKTETREMIVGLDEIAQWIIFLRSKGGVTKLPLGLVVSGDGLRESLAKYLERVIERNVR